MTDKLSKSNVWVRMTFLVIILSTIFRFVLTAFYYPSGDACRHLFKSKLIAWTFQIPIYFNNVANWDSPLPHLVSSVLYHIGNLVNSSLAEFLIKYGSFLFGTGNVVLCYLILRKLTDKKTTFWALLFFAFLPINISMGYLGYVDGAASFFVLLTIHFALSKRPLMASMAIILGGYTRYLCAAAVPIVIYIFYLKSKPKNRLKNISLFLVPYILLGFWWNVRNFFVFGEFFKTGRTHEIIFFGVFDYLRTPFIQFVAAFGVPNGNLSLFNVFGDFKLIIFSVWVLIMLLFIFPAIIGFVKKFKKIKNDDNLKIIFFWLLIYFMMNIFLLIIRTPGKVELVRYFLPVFLVIGYFWAIGILKLKQIQFFKQNKWVFVLILLLFLSFFIVQESVKMTIAKNQWKPLQQDLQQVEKIVSSNEVLYSFQKNHPHCLAYYMNREILELRPSDDVISDLDMISNEASYTLIKNDLIIQWQINNTNQFKAGDNALRLQYLFREPFIGKSIGLYRIKNENLEKE